MRRSPLGSFEVFRYKNALSRSEQDRIVSILAPIDRKIKLNHQINDYLIQLKQAKYQKLKSEISGLACSIGSLVQETIGGDWGKDVPTGNFVKKVLCIRGADIPDLTKGNQGKAPIRYILTKNYDKKALLEQDIIVEVSGGSPTQSTGRAVLVSKGAKNRFSDDLICTNFCRIIRPKKVFSHYLNETWQDLYRRGIFFSYENGTTGIKNLDLSSILENEEIIVPSEAQLCEFNSFCENIDNLIFLNGAESEALCEIRDSLLPKLLSGEIEVA